MGSHCGLLVRTIYMLCLLGLCYSDKKCNPSNLDECGTNETCQQVSDAGSTLGVCKCSVGYQKYAINGPCLPTPTTENSFQGTSTSNPPVSTEMAPLPSVSASTIAAGIIIPLLLFGTIGMVLAARRYQWLQRLRHLRVRRYDEVRIGQDDDDDDDDDPPLA